jgi:FkbM family methyltransferase
MVAAVNPILRRGGARLRRGLGLEGLVDRFDRIDTRLDQLERAVQGARWPRGPVYLGQNEAVVATRWGSKIIVDTNDRSFASWLLLDGLWESQVTGWMHDALAPGGVMVDVGANVGYFTLLAAHCVGPAGRVVAVEPHPRLCEILRRNVVLNGHHPNVTVCGSAAWSGPERLNLHLRVNYPGSSSLSRSADLEAMGDSEETVEVEAIALDQILGDLTRIDVMKIDIEGAEVHAFRGLAQTLESHPEMALMLEWSPVLIERMGDDPRELVDNLAGRGYHFRVVENDLAPITGEALLGLPYGNVLAER